MNYVHMGTNGARVPAVGQGTWRMGVDASQQKSEVESLRTGIEAGMTLIDTAEMYADGGAERVVAQAIADCRSDVFLVTKVWPSHADYEGTLRAAKASLDRLKTEYIDLYLLHWPSREHPVADTMRAMRRLIDDGLVRCAGVSNFSAELMSEAQDALGDVPLTADQLPFHLNRRTIEREVLPACNARGVAVMAYSPLGQGDFPAPGSAGRDVLDRIGAQYGKTAYQIALRWVVAHEGVVAIPKAVNLDHVRQNAESAEIPLTDADRAALEEAFPLPEGDYQVKWM